MGKLVDRLVDRLTDRFADRLVDRLAGRLVGRLVNSIYIEPIEMVCNMYAKRRLFVTTLLADPEFKHLESFLNQTG